MSNAIATNNFTTFLQTVVVANSYYPALASKTATNPPSAVYAREKKL